MVGGLGIAVLLLCSSVGLGAPGSAVPHPPAPLQSPGGVVVPTPARSVLPGVPRTPSGSAVPAASFHAAAPMAGARRTGPLPTGSGPLSGAAYYLQEATYLDSACPINVPNQCTSSTNFTAWGVTVTVARTAYLTGYEFNGLTETGDWYQTAVLYNWCSPGNFSWGNEAYDANGFSVYPTTGGMGCEPGPTFAAGDTVALSLQLQTNGTHAGDVCFSAQDLTQGESAYQNCIAQPDPGPNASQNRFRWGESKGYFTGPMMEYLDNQASSCLNLTGLPTVPFETTPGAYVTSFTPASDLWDPGTGSICYSTTSLTTVAQSPGDGTATLVDGSGGSAFGPHWMMTQNLSVADPADGWEFTADALVPTPDPTPNATDAGASGHVAFVDPVREITLDGRTTTVAWAPSSGLTGCAVSTGPDALTCPTPTASGNYSATLTLAEVGGHSATSAPGVLRVDPNPAVARVHVAPATVDVGQTVAFNATAVGGTGTFRYQWTGLPSGCSTGPDVPDPVCTPLTPANLSVTVTVTDSLGVSATSPAIALEVFPDPTLALALNQSNLDLTDLGQRFTVSVTEGGGSPGVSFRWSGAPSTCPTTTSGPLLVCVPDNTGNFTIAPEATDSDGMTATGPPVALTVYRDPTATLEASASAVSVGQATVLTVRVDGGLSPFSVVWSGLPPGCTTANSTSLTCTPSASGRYVVSANVTDQLGARTTTTVVLEVAASPIVTTTFVLELGGVIGAALIAIALVLWVRNRRLPRRGSRERGVAGSRYAPSGGTRLATHGFDRRGRGGVPVLPVSGVRAETDRAVPGAEVNARGAVSSIPPRPKRSSTVRGRGTARRDEASRLPRLRAWGEGASRQSAVTTAVGPG